jgi:glucose-1-phosphate adenylyltransferase
VREAVLFHDVVVRAGASISRAVVDADSEIGAGAQLGFGEPAADAADDVVLVAADSAVPQGARLGPGTRYPSDEDEGGERV